MDTQKLHDLIDKVIGKDGPLRTPAYWMWRVLRAIVDTLSMLEAKIGGDFLKLEHSIKISLNNCIKRIPEFTYAELAEMAEKRILIAGQKYMFKYDLSISRYASSELNAGYSGERYIILEAIDSSEFSPKGLVKYSVYLTRQDFIEVDFYFPKKRASDIHEIGMYLNEFPYFDLKTNNGELVRMFISDQKDTSSLTYKSEDGSITKRFTTSGTLLSIRKGEKIDEGEIVYVPDDGYRGIILGWHDTIANYHVPADPNIGLNFTINTPIRDVVIDYIGFSREERNVIIKPRKQRDKYYVPRVYVEENAGQSGMVVIGNNCNKIYISNDYQSTRNIIVENSCSDIAILRPLSRSEFIKIPSGSQNVTIYNTDPQFIGACENVCIAGEENGTTRMILHKNKNLMIDASFLAAQDFSILPMGDSCMDGTSDSDWLKLGDIGVFDGCNVGKDSNGNIRCWNPADYVDAIEPDEQTTETTEE